MSEPEQDIEIVLQDVVKLHEEHVSNYERDLACVSGLASTLRRQADLLIMNQFKPENESRIVDSMLAFAFEAAARLTKVRQALALLDQAQKEKEEVK